MRQLLANPLVNPSTGHTFAPSMASGSSSAAQSPAPALPNPYAPLGTGGYNMGGGPLGYTVYGNPSKHAAGLDIRHVLILSGIEFKSSPYYQIKEQLGAPVVCEGMRRDVQRLGLTS